jgi:hypothetical protein
MVENFSFLPKGALIEMAKGSIFKAYGWTPNWGILGFFLFWHVFPFKMKAIIMTLIQHHHLKMIH